MCTFLKNLEIVKKLENCQMWIADFMSTLSTPIVVPRCTRTCI